MSDLFKSILSDVRATGDCNSCTVVAFSVLTGVPFKTAQAMFDAEGRERGKGFGLFKTIAMIEARGKTVRDVTPFVKAKTIRGLKKEGLRGNYLIDVRGHVLAMTGGEIHDWTDGRCHRIIRVFKVS